MICPKCFHDAKFLHPFPATHVLVYCEAGCGWVASWPTETYEQYLEARKKSHDATASKEEGVCSVGCACKDEQWTQAQVEEFVKNNVKPGPIQFNRIPKTSLLGPDLRINGLEFSADTSDHGNCVNISASGRMPDDHSVVRFSLGRVPNESVKDLVDALTSHIPKDQDDQSIEGVGNFFEDGVFFRLARFDGETFGVVSVDPREFFDLGDAGDKSCPDEDNKVVDIENHFAFFCDECGSTKYNLLKSGAIECAGCQKTLVGSWWGMDTGKEKL